MAIKNKDKEAKSRHRGAMLLLLLICAAIELVLSMWLGSDPQNDDLHLWLFSLGGASAAIWVALRFK